MSPEVLRRINREVAAKYLPGLAPLFDSLVTQGFEPKVISLSFDGESRAYFNQLIELEESRLTLASVVDSSPSR
jgi:hypothetical protein